MAGRQSLHQGVQRVTELAAERRHMLGAIALDLHGPVRRVRSHHMWLEMEFQRVWITF